MCVVLICPPKQRPDLTILRACHAANPHGAGVAWRDKRRIHWRKALTPGEVNHLIQKVPGEVIIHFRWASVGGVEPLLCHPFPVTAEAALGYEGLCKSALFHNGTWGNWEAAQEIIGTLDGPMSDSRAVAALVHHKGTKLLKKLPGRWAVMGSKEIGLFGDWQPWRGLLVSNTSFTPYLAESARRAFFFRWKNHPPRARRARRGMAHAHCGRQAPRAERATAWAESAAGWGSERAWADCSPSALARGSCFPRRCPAGKLSSPPHTTRFEMPLLGHKTRQSPSFGAMVATKSIRRLVHFSTTSKAVTASHLRDADARRSADALRSANEASYVRAAVAAREPERTFVELFAGIGLIHEAFAPFGWRALLANDNDPRKVRAYRANFPGVLFDDGDVRMLDLCAQPAARLVTASFPCIDLSQAGNRQGLNGEHSSLVRTFLQKVALLTAAAKKPEFLLLENVPNLLSIHDGAALDEILRTLAELRYGFDVVQVDAKHFTPQSRNRVFIVAVDLERHALPARAFPDDHLHRHKLAAAYQKQPGLPWFFFDFPPLPTRQLSLRDVLERVPEESKQWWDKEQEDYFWSLVEHDHRTRLESLLKSGKRQVFTAVRRLRRRRKREQIFNIRFDGLASCLRTPGGGSSTQYVVVLEDGKLRGRRLTALESARLQGVCLPGLSPDFQLVGTDTDIRYAFGDAVCVPAVRWVIEHSIEQLIPDTAKRRFAPGVQEQLALV